MQTYTIGPVTLFLEKDNQFTPVSMTFEFSVPFNYIVPDDQDEAIDYHNSIARTIKFFQGIHASYVLESSYENTEPFVTGRINNITIEVPDGCNKVPLLGVLFYYKALALMNNFPIEEFKLQFNIIESSTETVKTELLYNDMTMLGSKLESIIKHYEEHWTSELLEEHNDIKENVGDEIEDATDEDFGPLTAWWHRLDGQVRDFVNVQVGFVDENGDDIDEVSEEFAEMMMKEYDGIRVLSVDIGEEPIAATKNPSPEEPDPDNGYYNI